MMRLILSRLWQTPLILLVIFLATFLLTWVLPGSPLDRPEGQRPPVEIQQAMLRQYHLDSPGSFLASYARSAFLQGDLGPSLTYRDQRVNDILAAGLPVSMTLGLLAMGLALHLGLFIGWIGALWPRSLADRAGLGLVLMGVSLPSFVTGSLLLVIFAGVLGWFPLGGWGTPGHMILPALTLAAMPAAYIARLTRLGLAEVMKSDCLRTAKAKGLSPAMVLLKHGMKLAFLPVLSFLGPATAGVMTGGFVVEQVFALPGIGEHFVNAVLNKDQFLILGVVMVYSTLLILLNLLVDLAYAWVDPRIQLQG